MRFFSLFLFGLFSMSWASPFLLSNGIRCDALERKGGDMLSAAILIPTGIIYEKANEKGAALALATLYRKGKLFPPSFRKKLREKWISYRVELKADQLLILLKGRAKPMLSLLEEYGRVFFLPKWKKNTKLSLPQSLPSKNASFLEDIQKIMYGAHPFHISGTSSSPPALKNIIRFQKRTFSSKGAVVVLVGKREKEKLEEKCRKIFEKIPAKKRQTIASPHFLPLHKELKLQPSQAKKPLLFLFFAFPISSPYDLILTKTWLDFLESDSSDSLRSFLMRINVIDDFGTQIQMKQNWIEWAIWIRLSPEKEELSRSALLWALSHARHFPNPQQIKKSLDRYSTEEAILQEDSLNQAYLLAQNIYYGQKELKESDINFLDLPQLFSRLTHRVVIVSSPSAGASP